MKASISWLSPHRFMWEKVLLHEAYPKIHKCSQHIILLCGGNEENALFLIESLGGVTQQETP